MNTPVRLGTSLGQIRQAASQNSFQQKLLKALLIVLLTASVERNFEKQLVLFVLGMCQGELVYSCVFQKFAGVMAVGGFHCVSAWSAWI
ncbi:hypothetical protein BOH71_19110 [Bacillus subtilis]|nr:hypothetical protein BOH71_19110 [Bacillus subtilis]